MKKQKKAPKTKARRIATQKSQRAERKSPKSHKKSAPHHRAITKTKKPVKKIKKRTATVKKTPEKKRATGKKSGAIKKPLTTKPIIKKLMPQAPKARKDLSAPPQRKAYVIKAGEAYMNQAQLEHFKNLLLQWKEELLRGMEITVQDMQTTSANFPDPVDRASQEEEFNLELRTRDRERKLVKKIEEALQRIEDNNYGYCDECGAEIGIRRLEARPTATQCIECKTIAEIREKQIGEVSREGSEE